MQYWIGVLTIVGIYMIAVLGVSILCGFTGMFSMGHAGFMAIGGYVSALLTKNCGMPIFMGILGGMLAASLVGYLISYPTLRLRDDYFIIVTLGIGEAIKLIIQNTESITGGDGDAIIPLKAASEARRLLEGDAVMTIRLGDKQCTFVAGGFELTTKLIEGTYPNYRQVVPASFARTVEVPTSVFLAKIETVSLVLSDSSSYIILRFENNQLNLQASSAEVGEGSDMVEIAFEGEPFEVSFNPAYLADPLRNADADKIRMKINDPLNPVAIEGSEGFLYVIMPIRKK